MSGTIKNIGWLGTSLRFNGATNRNIYLSNIISLILFTLLLLLSIIHLLFLKDHAVALLCFPQAILFLFVPLLNKNGFINLSRYLLIINIVYGMLVLTIARKLDGEVSESTYFVGRSFIVVFSALLPIVIFHLKERRHLLNNMILSLFAWTMFDPIHELLHIGYYQVGHSSTSYYYNNFLFLLIYMAVVSVIWYLKATLEAYENRNEKNINILDEKNAQIKKQKLDLEEKNSILINLLNKQEEDVAVLNQELIRKNNELLHFSYAISHNLRGPVASLLGLVGLIENCNNVELGTYIKCIDKSAKLIDATIKDLNSLLEVNHNYTPELIQLDKELSEIALTYQTYIEKYNVKLTSDLGVKELYSVRPFVYSIMSQLISNAIKYRSQERKSMISFRSRKEHSFFCMEVEDNGTGFEIGIHKESLFKPFKRFHETSGKGLGLYLVKLQVEKLGGSIDVKSKPGVGSLFTVYLKE